MTRAHVATVARRARDVVQRDALLIGGHPHQVEEVRDSTTGTGRWIALHTGAVLLLPLDQQLWVTRVYTSRSEYDAEQATYTLRTTTVRPPAHDTAER